MLISFVCKFLNNLLTTEILLMYRFFIILIHFITFVLLKIDAKMMMIHIIRPSGLIAMKIRSSTIKCDALDLNCLSSLLKTSVISFQIIRD